MTEVEDRSHFTLWCFMSFPLIMGHDVRTQSATTQAILTNKELLVISADPMGRPAWLIGGLSQLGAKTQVYLRQLFNGDYAAALFNRDDKQEHTIVLMWAAMYMPTWQPMEVINLWHDDSMVSGNFSGNVSANVPPHGIIAIRLRQLPYLG